MLMRRLKWLILAVVLVVCGYTAHAGRLFHRNNCAGCSSPRTFVSCGFPGYYGCSTPVCGMPSCGYSSCSMPVCSMPVCSMPMCSGPMCSMPACSMPACGFPVYSAPSCCSGINYAAPGSASYPGMNPIMAFDQTTVMTVPGNNPAIGLPIQSYRAVPLAPPAEETPW